MTIRIARETEQRMIASIKRYFEDNSDDDIGDLTASLLLDFVLREIGPSIYNQAIGDAQALHRARGRRIRASPAQPSSRLPAAEALRSIRRVRPPLSTADREEPGCSRLQARPSGEKRP